MIIVCSSMTIFLFEQKTAYEMRISDWSSDVCSSDLGGRAGLVPGGGPCALAVGAGRQGGTAPCAPGRRRGRTAADIDAHDAAGDRKSVVSGKSVPVRTDLGGCRIIKKNKH